MINSVVLVGRTTKDIELRKTTNGTSVVSFTLAVNRDKDTSYFLNCVAYKGTADLIHNYVTKGSMIGVSGQLTSRSYDGKQGKVYVTEVLVNNVQFLSQNQNNVQQSEPVYDELNTSSDINFSPDELPFY